MSQDADDRLAAKAYCGVLVAGLLLSLAANLPGHMSVDSVIALEQARTGVRQTWAPAAFSWVLGLFDGRLPGAALYVAASSAMLFGALMSLPALRRRSSWAAVGLAVLVVLTPQALIYQGIVWRDVLFANLTLAGFVLLARADLLWAERRAWGSLAGAAFCLALGAAVRQNGVVLVLAAAVALAWSARGGGRRAMLGWGVGGFVLTSALALALTGLAKPAQSVPHLRPGAEALILQHYDIVGAVAHDPGLPLTEIARANPAAAARIAAQGPRIYSASRVDTLDLDPEFRRTLWKLPDAAVGAQWRDLILHHPGAYLAHRLDVFGWLLLTPDLSRCLPVQVGVVGPPDMLEELEIDSAPQPKDAALRSYAAMFYGTPVYSHLSWALVAAVCAVLLLIRRQRADTTMAALLVGALAFTASFLVISVACDYRYLYLLDLAAMTGVLYLALDLSGFRRPRP
ncbi:hypothetical protein [Phenylobacterium sp.]|uniref:hypothetical protein n=1 Tax=Phenylobacterium sp. TaxID=1871053 RepID=UPI002DE285C8|nr:hypothetical protein [Phenylobacterium sp.]